MEATPLSAQCCIVGGGPAGMMLGLLLARSGIDVVVLEKHADFLRDFRGDTIHPSTLEIMYELGMLEDFLALSHQEVTTLTARIGGVMVPVVDLTHVPTHCKFIALMPQWDFLNFIADRARVYPTFRLLMRTAATGLIEDSGRIAGVSATGPDGPLDIRSDLVIGADGRHSVVREKSGLVVDDLGAPMDVLWFRLSRHSNDPEEIMAVFDVGRLLVMLNRGDYWQCAFVIAKGSIEEVRGKGLPAFQEAIAAAAPFIRDRIQELADWDQIKLLTVGVDRLRRWHRPGLLCIGDAAHTMSPIGGVGINLAVQDAIAAANLLAEKLRENRVTDDDLHRVQVRRELPTRVTQRAQIIVQNRVITRILRGKGPLSPPWPVRLLARFPILRRIPARLVGVGIRPEHVRTEAAPPVRRTS